MSMCARNVIELKINIAGEQVVSYERGLSEIKQQNIVKELNLRYLLTVNELVELLELTRAAFERNILENESINTGVRHLHVTGENFPRIRIYVDAVDLIEYLIKYCDLTYWKKEQVGGNKYLLKGLKNQLIDKEDVEYLAVALIEGRFKSSKTIENEFNRTRRIVSRLNNIIESVTFAFPGSQRQLRRFIFSPKDDNFQIRDYFSGYKSYENQVTKIIED
jgi:hypothetical protein